MKLDEKQLKQILINGFDISLGEYYNHCKINTEKTFYYFIENLIKVEKGKYVESSALREYIISKLSGVFAINSKFNPEGWFGRSWTEGEHDRTSYFKKTYSDILDRTDTEPYKYRIKPDLYEIVQSTFYNLFPDSVTGKNIPLISSNKFTNITELVNNSEFPFNLKNKKIQIKDLKGIVIKISKNGDWFELFDGKKKRKFRTAFFVSIK